MRPLPPLYKYAPPDRVDVFEHLKIRFTQAEALNDPFECSPFVGEFLSREAIASTAPSEHTLEMLGAFQAENMGAMSLLVISNGPTHRLIDSSRIAQFLDRISEPELCDFVMRTNFELLRRGFRMNFGIFSLAATRENLLMWSHYAANHTGIVIGFDTTHEFFRRPRWRHASVNLAAANAVIYTNQRPHFPYLSDVTKTAVFLTKSRAWAYEQEWRMVRTIDEATETRVDDRGVPVYLFDIPPEALQSVVLGAASQKSVAERVRAAIDSNPRLNHVTVLRASVDEKRFRLTFGDADGDEDGNEPS